MGRRSRAREAATGPAGRDGEAGRPAGMTPARRTLAAYLAGATLVAVLVLLGIASLGGSLGPLVVAVAAVLAAVALQRWAAARLGDAPLEAEDQTLRAVATGLLLLAVAFAVLAAIIVAVS
jgi:hypothetical protein